MHISTRNMVIVGVIAVGIWRPSATLAATKYEAVINAAKVVEKIFSKEEKPHLNPPSKEKKIPDEPLKDDGSDVARQTSQKGLDPTLIAKEAEKCLSQPVPDGSYGRNSSVSSDSMSVKISCSYSTNIPQSGLAMTSSKEVQDTQGQGSVTSHQSNDVAGAVGTALGECIIWGLIAAVGQAMRRRGRWRHASMWSVRKMFLMVLIVGTVLTVALLFSGATYRAATAPVTLIAGITFIRGSIGFVANIPNILAHRHTKPVNNSEDH